ncbi:hypothetical protein G6F43_005187 [Rhizopus delemar]|nr:hypothetical protein G6F43_005187 [Rhizopus delemar]
MVLLPNITKPSDQVDLHTTASNAAQPVIIETTYWGVSQSPVNIFFDVTCRRESDCDLYKLAFYQLKDYMDPVVRKSRPNRFLEVNFNIEKFRILACNDGLKFDNGLVVIRPGSIIKRVTLQRLPCFHDVGIVTDSDTDVFLGSGYAVLDCSPSPNQTDPFLESTHTIEWIDPASSEGLSSIFIHAYWKDTPTYSNPTSSALPGVTPPIAESNTDITGSTAMASNSLSVDMFSNALNANDDGLTQLTELRAELDITHDLIDTCSDEDVPDPSSIIKDTKGSSAFIDRRILPIPVNSYSIPEDARCILAKFSHTNGQIAPFHILVVYAPASSPRDRQKLFDTLLAFQQPSSYDPDPRVDRMTIAGDFSNTLKSQALPSRSSVPSRWLHSSDAILKILYLDLSINFAEADVEFLNFAWTDHALLQMTLETNFQLNTGPGIWRANPIYTGIKEYRQQLANMLTTLYNQEIENSSLAPQGF